MLCSHIVSSMVAEIWYTEFISAFIASFKNKEIEILILLTVCVHSSFEKKAYNNNNYY